MLYLLDSDSIRLVAGHLNPSYHFLFKFVNHSFRDDHKKTESNVKYYTSNITLLKWAFANGYSGRQNTCTLAAGNGHLEVLKWLRAPDSGDPCPWTG